MNDTTTTTDPDAGWGDVPVEPTGPLTIGTIPDADLDRMIAATIPTEPTWRDVDGLTPAQRERMAARENLLRSSYPDDIAAKLLLDAARRNARLNRRDAEAFGHVPVPAGAVYVWHWDSDDESCRWQRELEGPSWLVDELRIDILGTQTADGVVAWRLALESTEPTFCGDAAQQLGRAIAAAVAELARLEDCSATGAGQ